METRLRRTLRASSQLPTTGYAVVDESVILGQEQFDETLTGKWFPINWDVLCTKYAIPSTRFFGNLRFQTTPTTWLARDSIDWHASNVDRDREPDSFTNSNRKYALQRDFAVVCVEKRCSARARPRELVDMLEPSREILPREESGACCWSLNKDRIRSLTRYQP